MVEASQALQVTLLIWFIVLFIDGPHLAAIALGRLPDMEITVFDQARELKEIGASIALQPCALRCLEKMGLGDEVEKLAYRCGEHPLVCRMRHKM